MGIAVSESYDSLFIHVHPNEVVHVNSAGGGLTGHILKTGSY